MENFIVNNFVKMSFFNLISNTLRRFTKWYFQFEYLNKNKCIGIYLPVLLRKSSRTSKIELICFTLRVYINYFLSTTCKHKLLNIGDVKNQNLQ